MSTFYQRFLIYQQRPDATKFKERDRKVIGMNLAKVFDSREQTIPFTIEDSLEDGILYRVRNYPNTFDYTIDCFIRNRHEFLTNKPAKKKKAPPATTQEKKARKRIPKPAFRLRNIN